MLVLSRRTGQKIVIGNEIVIEVVAISSEGVRLGITAPAQTSVHRHEVFVEIMEANRAAAGLLDKNEQSALHDLSAHIRTKQK
ncbi:MAG: carbon storage regulator [Acidobacteriota bacterium]